MLALKQQHLQQAETIADQALKYDPNHSEAWHAKGAIAYAQGNLKQAEKNYTRSLELEPNHYTARVSRASVYIELGRHDDAVKELNELSETSRWDPQVSYFLAVARRKAGDTAGAKEALRHAADLVNSAPYEKLLESRPLLLIAGLINYSNGEVEKAHRFLADYISRDRSNLIAHKLLGATLLAMQEPLKAIPVLQRATELAPKAPNLHNQLAKAYFQAGQYRKAISSLQTADYLAPGQSDTLLQLGISHLAASNRKMAIKELEAAFREKPDSNQAAQILSAVHLSEGNPQRAIEILLPLVKRQPNNPTSANILASTYLHLDQLELAREWYEKALSIKPGFRPAIINLAKLDLRQNKSNKARQALEGLLADEPKNPRLLYELATLEKRTGSPEAAIRLLEKAYGFDQNATYVAFRLIDLSLETGNLDRALEIASDLQRQFPDNLQVFQTMGRIQLALGNPAAAKVSFKHAAKLAGFKAEALYTIAQWQLQAGSAVEARWSLQKAIEGDPEFLPALQALAALEIRLDKLESAAKLIERFSTHDKSNPAVNRLSGDLALRKKEFNRAIGFYNQALEQLDDPDLAIRRFLARNATSGSAKALPELADWVKNHPAGIAAKRVLAETYHNTGQLEQAKVLYEALFEQDQKSAALVNNLANLYADIGDPRSLKFALKAYELAPTNPNIIDTLGWFLVSTGQIEEGLGYLRDASARSPKKAEIHYHLAVALEELDRRGEALQELKEALRLNNTFPGSSEARRRLTILENR